MQARGQQRIDGSGGSGGVPGSDPGAAAGNFCRPNRLIVPGELGFGLDLDHAA